MILLENEGTLWESNNKQLLLTTHRLREMQKGMFTSKIKSIMLEEITACELRTIRQFRYLGQALLLFLIMNGSVYLLNHYLFEAVLIKFFFGDVQIDAAQAQIVFYLSLLLAALYITLFIFSIKKVFSFYSSGLTIDFQVRWLDFEEREHFISRVEEAKDKRRKTNS